VWLQTKEAKTRIELYFGRIQALSQSEKLESRVRFALQVGVRLLPAAWPVQLLFLAAWLLLLALLLI
jgi:hypothetical protein